MVCNALVVDGRVQGRAASRPWLLVVVGQVQGSKEAARSVSLIPDA